MTTPHRSALREVSAFFAREGRIWETMRRIRRAFATQRIRYAIGGDMAMVLHGFNRCADTIEIITAPDACARAREVAGDPPASVRLCFVVADAPVASVKIDGYSVIALAELIDSKIVSASSAEYRRYRDLGDVQRLIAACKLPRQFAQQLAITSREEFDRLWDLAQTPDPHEQGS